MSKSELGKSLFEAASEYDLKTLRKILGSDPPPSPDVINFRNKNGNTPLMMGAQCKKSKDACTVLKYLLATPGIAIDLQNKQGYTALMFAAKRPTGGAEVCKLLLENKAEFETLDNDDKQAIQHAKDEATYNVLYHAALDRIYQRRQDAIRGVGTQLLEFAASNNVNEVEIIIANSPLVECYTYVDPNSKNKDDTPLSIAVRQSQLEMVQMLLSAGADLSRQDKAGRTLLMQVIQQPRQHSYPNSKHSRAKEDSRVALFDSLLEFSMDGSHLNVCDKSGANALMTAAHMGYVYDTKAILNYCHLHCTEDTITEEHPMGSFGLKGMVDRRQIPKYQVWGTARQRERRGDTALVIASRRGHKEVVRTLIDLGKADVNLRGLEGMSPLMWAAYNDDMEMLKFLVLSGADLNLQSEVGKTALFFAIERSNFEIAKHLLLYAHYDILDYTNYWPLPSMTVTEAPNDEASASSAASASRSLKRIAQFKEAHHSVGDDEKSNIPKPTFSAKAAAPPSASQKARMKKAKSSKKLPSTPLSSDDDGSTSGKSSKPGSSSGKSPFARGVSVGTGESKLSSKRRFVKLNRSNTGLNLTNIGENDADVDGGLSMNDSISSVDPEEDDASSLGDESAANNNNSNTKLDEVAIESAEEKIRCKVNHLTANGTSLAILLCRVCTIVEQKQPANNPASSTVAVHSLPKHKDKDKYRPSFFNDTLEEEDEEEEEQLATPAITAITPRPTTGHDLGFPYSVPHRKPTGWTEALAIETMKLLVERKMNLNVRNAEGFTALIWAVSHHQNELAKYLIMNGADPTIKNLDGHTASRFLRDDDVTLRLLLSEASGLFH